MDYVSTTVSPMIAMGRAIQAKDPLARVVFIGPCTAKKVEVKQPKITAGEPSSYGRIFARSGGVAESVRRVAKLEGMVCKNGCTNGAASIFHEQKGIERVNSFGREALTDDPTEGVRGYDMNLINMEREFEI